MNHKVGVRILMIVGGVVTGMIAIGHIFMPEFGYDKIVPQAMEYSVREHFYYLGTYAVCLFLMVFSALSLFFSGFKYPKATSVVCTMLFVFWCGRTVLEVVYPVNLKIFFLDNPHVVLLPVISTLCAVYFVSTVKSWYLVRRA